MSCGNIFGSGLVAGKPPLRAGAVPSPEEVHPRFRAPFLVSELLALDVGIGRIDSRRGLATAAAPIDCWMSSPNGR
jgi:hypothetical protein